MTAEVTTVHRHDFAQRLHAASAHAVRMARDLVRQALPDPMVYFVHPNQSADGGPRVGDEVVCPEDSLADGQRHGPWTAAQVVDFLWRSGRVPEWIDASVVAEDGERTFVQLLCCGRFTARAKLRYHRRHGQLSPFAIKSPPIPPEQAFGQPSRFDLYWQEAARRRRLRAWPRLKGSVRRWAAVLRSPPV